MMVPPWLVSVVDRPCTLSELASLRPQLEKNGRSSLHDRMHAHLTMSLGTESSYV